MKFRVFIFYGAAFLAVAAIVSLAILYSGSVGKPNEDGPLGDSFVAARVDGVEITGGDINREIATLEGEQPAETAELKRRQQDALEMLIQLQLLKNEAAARGIEVSDSQLTERFNQYLSQGREAFDALLAQNNLTEEQFRIRLREDMLIEQLGAKVRNELVEKIEIADSEIESFYQENMSNFDMSEIAHIYIRIQPPGGEEQIEAARKKATEAVARLERGVSFPQVARQYSDDTQTKNSGGVLGPLNSGLLSNKAMSVASQLKAGEFTQEPLQIQDGFQIIKRIDEKYLPLEQVKENIRQRLMQNRVEKAFEKWLADARSRANVKIYL